MQRLLLVVLFLGCLIGRGNLCLSSEQEQVLITPDNHELTEEERTALFASYANMYEMLVFTYDRPRICPACDIARPTLKRMKEDYPLTFIDVEDAENEVLCEEWDVNRYPTFIFVKRRIDGSAQEIKRWSGVSRLEHKIEEAFNDVGFDVEEYVPRPRILPPPRPLPGPKPDVIPPKRGPKPKEGPKPQPQSGPKPKEGPKPQPQPQDGPKPPRRWYNPMTWF